MPNPDPPKEHDHVIEQLLSRTWGELEVLEQDGRLFFPEKIYKRGAKGEFDGTDVLLTVPREPDLRWARGQGKPREQARQAALAWQMWLGGSLKEMPQYAPITNDTIPVIPKRRRKTKATKSYKDFCNG